VGLEVLEWVRINFPEIMDCRSILIGGQPAPNMQASPQPSPSVPSTPSPSTLPPITLQRKRAVSGATGGSTFPIPVSIIDCNVGRERDPNSVSSGGGLSPRDKNRWSEGRVGPNSPRARDGTEGLAIGTSGSSRSNSPRSANTSPRFTAQAQSPPQSQLLGPFTNAGPVSSREMNPASGLPAVPSFVTSSGGVSLTEAVRDLERERRSRDNSPRVSSPTSSSDSQLTTISVTLEEGGTSKLASIGRISFFLFSFFLFFSDSQF
jgi:hypothetical protein